MAVPAAPRNSLPPKIVQEIGEDLFNLLFVKGIYSAYSQSCETAHKKQLSVRYRLRFGSPHLAYLPWEALFNGKEYLALSTKTPVIRSAELDLDEVLPQEALPLCVLGMIPKVRRFNDIDLAPLNVEAEQDNIKTALADLEDAHQAILQWAGGSARDLTRRLNHPPQGCKSWHIFHFCGHGGFDEGENMGFVFVDPDPAPVGLPASINDARPLYASDLKYILENSRGLRLVILNSCKGGAGGPGAASAAEWLVSNGFSAVIAMQFEITDEAAIWFCRDLYTELADGQPVHRAVTIARQTLKRAGTPEWLTPVLYMRNRDGRLFKIVSSG